MRYALRCCCKSCSFSEVRFESHSYRMKRTDLKLLSGGWMRSKWRFQSFAAAFLDVVVVRVQFIIMAKQL